MNEIKFPYVPKHGEADVTADADDSPVQYDNNRIGIVLELCANHKRISFTIYDM